MRSFALLSLFGFFLRSLQPVTATYDPLNPFSLVNVSEIDKTTVGAPSRSNPTDVLSTLAKLTRTATSNADSYIKKHNKENSERFRKDPSLRERFPLSSGGIPGSALREFVLSLARLYDQFFTENLNFLLAQSRPGANDNDDSFYVAPDGSHISTSKGIPIYKGIREVQTAIEALTGIDTRVSENISQNDLDRLRSIFELIGHKSTAKNQITESHLRSSVRYFARILTECNLDRLSFALNQYQEISAKNTLDTFVAPYSLYLVHNTITMALEILIASGSFQGYAFSSLIESMLISFPIFQDNINKISKSMITTYSSFINPDETDTTFDILSEYLAEAIKILPQQPSTDPIELLRIADMYSSIRQDGSVDPTMTFIQVLRYCGDIIRGLFPPQIINSDNLDNVAMEIFEAARQFLLDFGQLVRTPRYVRFFSNTDITASVFPLGQASNISQYSSKASEFYGIAITTTKDYLDIKYLRAHVKKILEKSFVKVLSSAGRSGKEVENYMGGQYETFYIKKALVYLLTDAQTSPRILSLIRNFVMSAPGPKTSASLIRSFGTLATVARNMFITAAGQLIKDNVLEKYWINEEKSSMINALTFDKFNEIDDYLKQTGALIFFQTVVPHILNYISSASVNSVLDAFLKAYSLVQSHYLKYDQKYGSSNFRQFIKYLISPLFISQNSTSTSTRLNHIYKAYENFAENPTRDTLRKVFYSVFPATSTIFPDPLIEKLTDVIITQINSDLDDFQKLERQFKSFKYLFHQILIMCAEESNTLNSVSEKFANLIESALNNNVSSQLINIYILHQLFTEVSNCSQKDPIVVELYESFLRGHVDFFYKPNTQQSKYSDNPARPIPSS